ncbi:sugar ABC transporter permease [Paenibacillus sp. P25]|nr:sugar ABC transporter permease [Paenibacillus sp. P25]
MKFSGRSLFQYWNKPERAAYLFITPSLLILLLFTAVPLISTLWISLLKLDIFLQDIRFLGLDNYARLWHDDRFWNALGNTVYFTLVEMPLQLIAALFTAVVVSKNTLTRKFLRSVFFLPSICSMTAIGIVWSFLLDPQMGMYPYALVKLGRRSCSFCAIRRWRCRPLS